jgi:hypothetical protein
VTTEEDVSKGAGVAIGTAAAACSVVPGIGTAACAAAAAIASAFTALGVAISSGLRDTYHPNAATALSWLTVWQFLPGALWTDNDTLQLDGFSQGANLVHHRSGTPAVDACRLVRYSLILGGLARPASPLYNPGDKGEQGSDANPYLESATPDPHHRLTDYQYVRRLWEQAKTHGVCSPQIHALIETPSEARHALSALRSPHFDRGIFTNWPMLGACLPALRREVTRARRLAGEHGPDPKLDGWLGSTDPHPHGAHAKPHHDRKVAGGFLDGLGFGLGLAPGLVIGGSLVTFGAMLYRRAQEKTK